MADQPIDYNALAAQNGAVSSTTAAAQPNQPAQASQPAQPNQPVDYSALAAQNGAISSTPSPASSQSSSPSLSDIVNAPPTGYAQADMGRGLVQAGQDVWNVVKHVAQHPIDTGVNILTSGGVVGAGKDLYSSIKESIPVIQAYESARSQGKSITDSLSAANDQAAKQGQAQQVLKQRIDDFKKNPTQAATRAVGDAAATAAAIWAGNQAVGAIMPEVGAGAADAAESTVAPEVETGAADQPSLYQQVMHGEKVAQPSAQAAVRQGVQSSTEAAGTADESVAANVASQPLVKGNTTLLDEPLAKLETNEKALYQKMDDTAGFDVKAEKAQLANDQFKLQQLGNTDADVTQRGNLIESINDSTDRIAEAEAKMQAAGIDPKAADAVHQQRMAGEDFQKSLVKNTDAADGSLNIKGLLSDAKNLRFSKWGDRLEQFMGKDGADSYVSHLKQANDLGVTALHRQDIAKFLGKWVLPEAVGGAIGTGYALSR